MVLFGNLTVRPSFPIYRKCSARSSPHVSQSGRIAARSGLGYSCSVDRRVERASRLAVTCGDILYQYYFKTFVALNKCGEMVIRASSYGPDQSAGIINTSLNRPLIGFHYWASFRVSMYSLISRQMFYFLSLLFSFSRFLLFFLLHEFSLVPGRFFSPLELLKPRERMTPKRNKLRRKKMKKKKKMGGEK